MQSKSTLRMTPLLTGISRAAALLAVCACCFAAFGQSLNNGDFTNGFITGDGDTIPLDWGSSAFSNGCCLYFDMVTFHNALGAARVEGCTDSCAWGFSAGVSNAAGTSRCVRRRGARARSCLRPDRTGLATERRS